MTITKTLSASVLVLTLFTAACGADDAQPAPETAGESPAADVTRLWIKPDLVDCVGEAEQQCMQVAESEDGEYLYFYDQIAGFTFEEGTGYVVDVTITEVADPPADGSSLAYTLVDIVEENPAG